MCTYHTHTEGDREACAFKDIILWGYHSATEAQTRFASKTCWRVWEGRRRIGLGVFHESKFLLAEKPYLGGL
jgi:hypothetical protein